MSRALILQVMETLYQRIGPEQLALLVERFYGHVFASPVISHLFKTDKAGIIEKQRMFLTQFLGGPQLYSERFGHPKMRMRHLPHAIDATAMEEWLRCMKLAVESLDISDDLKTALYNCFPPLAKHMVNS